MSFDTVIDRRGTGCAKWDAMEKLYGVPADDGLSMWVADMDFPAADFILDAGRGLIDHGVLGYQSDQSAYLNSIVWWMENRHGWSVKPEEIFTTVGLVNAVGLCLQTYTLPGDEIVLFTPVYHAFAKVIKAAGRQVKECLLVRDDAGSYHMDFDAYDGQMTGAEKMAIFCSPHNPGGRIWTVDEQKALAAFAARHNLIVLSDEIHHDLVFSGQKHAPFAVAAPEARDRTVMLTAPSKTFNLAGNHAGQVTIQDPALHAAFQGTIAGLGLSSTVFGNAMTAAAYSPKGAAWVDDLVAYIEGNVAIFEEGVNAVPGLRMMSMQSTYLAWVDFSGTGMGREDFTRRVTEGARIAPNYGPTFGTGGETWLRFNLGTQRARVEEATARLAAAFADLQ
ncbi:MAG: PatB family C-S lyase [Pseudomonadota bacterium]